MTLQHSSRRAILLGAFALTVAAAPAVGAVAVSDPNASTPVAECPPGYVMETTSGACVAAGEQNAPSAIPGNPVLPQVDGVPCTGANTGQCIGLQESQGGTGAPPIP